MRVTTAGETLRKGIGIGFSVPYLALLLAFIFDASWLEYVYLHGGSDLPLRYRVSALWAGRAGPLLLWVAMLGLLWWWDGAMYPTETAAQYRIRRRLHLGFTSFLLLVGFALGPFASTPEGWTEHGRPGLNALLQTDLMIIHPPLVFAFYTLSMGVGFHAIAMMLAPDRLDRERVLGLARPAFFVGTLGIGLGGLWAYTVLDWGGYWAWDPVETGSLLPWLALIMLLHLRLPKALRGGRLDDGRWLLGLAVLPAFFSVHATLVTRANGVWASIHTFVADGAGGATRGPLDRIMGIGVEDAAGAEVQFYLLCLVGMALLLTRHFNRLPDREGWLVAAAGMLVGYFIGGWIGSEEVGLLAGACASVLLTRLNAPDRVLWMACGVLLMLFGAWAYLIERPHAIAGMVLFLAPWILAADETDAKPASWRDPARWRQIALWGPLALGGPFLLLTWLLLLAEVDGASLASHELYGTPLIGLIALCLSIYAWHRVMPPERIPLAAGLVLVLALLGAAFAGSWMPGDADHSLSEWVSRGQLAAFGLPFLVMAIPPMFALILHHVREREGRIRPRARLANARQIATHVAHLGILLLLVGHLYTTTLVDRGDPSHVVMLPKDTPIEHDGYWFVFTEIEAVSTTDAAFDSDVGDGLIVVEIEIRDAPDGQVLATLEPGMLRFDEAGGFGRSETDTWHRPFGDLVLIFDGAQANQLEFASFMRTGESIDKVRVTVYDLTGSHLVWLGWSLMLAGSFATWTWTPARAQSTGSEEE